MKKTSQSILYFTVQDGKLLDEPQIMRGNPGEVLSMITLALHMFLERSGDDDRRIARALILDELNGVDIPKKNRATRRERLLAHLAAFVAGLFMLWGMICCVGQIVTWAAGRV